MNRLLKRIIFQLALCLTLLTYSQENSGLDSLTVILQEQTDTTRINTLYQIFSKQVRQEPTKVKPYVDSLLHESKSLGYQKFV
jgi:hypothetical protein